MASFNSNYVNCQSCQNEGYENHFKCLLQQNYIYLEQKLDSKNGFVSQMFQRKIISFSEKKILERITNDCDRNRAIIDLFFENKSHDHYLSFLDCLKANGQSHMIDYLNYEENISKSVDSKVSSTSPDNHGKGEFKFLGKIILEDKLAVMGLCSMNNSIYAICHMDPHVFCFLSIPPFIPQPFREFDLPVKKNQFHFYDMVCCEKAGILVVSDKANQRLWLADVDKKETSFIQVVDGCPLRMSLSSYATSYSDDEGYEDLYGENCKDAESSISSSIKGDEYKLDTKNDCIDCDKIIQRLLLEKLSFVDENVQSKEVALGKIPFEADETNILVVVISEGQHCINFYSNTLEMKLLKRISLMIGEGFCTSNAIQRRNDGHLFICYGEPDYGNKDNSPWYLGEYSPTGEMLRSYLSRPDVWIPRYIAMDEVDAKIIYAVDRFSGEIIKLKCIPGENVLNMSPLTISNHELTMPSRHRFCCRRRDNEKDELILLVGQGEIKKPHPSASIVVLKKICERDYL